VAPVQPDLNRATASEQHPEVGDHARVPPRPPVRNLPGAALAD